jgi:V/A-type H+-transporting ATPase subunit I
LGITNSLRRKDIERGIFGKEGLAGFMFYIGALILIVSRVYKNPLLPTFIWIIYFIFFLLLILLKQPLANMILGKKTLFEAGAKDYFIESGFEVVETLLSMFTNTLSFIRIGAFALNHVGLFVAFSAMAAMTKNGFASILILILGNVIIICLEGLIVFIQGLRLEYYELFSKYYEGGGVTFEPVKVRLK